MSRRRTLSDEERVLWTGVVRSIAPLRPAQDSPQSAPRDLRGKAVHAEKRPSAGAENSAEKKAPPLAPLGRRLKQRVARGREPIDARLDLHGMTQMEAHMALLSFLRRAQADGAKIALIVTGKGTAKGADARDGATGRGVLKRQVPLWLSLAEFRPFVVGFEDAHIGHGGQGALYVRLRRAR
jgi:DNA-nicking Smr family endonuclease